MKKKEAYRWYKRNNRRSHMWEILRTARRKLGLSLSDFDKMINAHLKGEYHCDSLDKKKYLDIILKIRESARTQAIQALGVKHEQNSK